MERLIAVVITSLCLIGVESCWADNARHQFAIEEATISSVHSAIRDHHLTCEQLVQAYIDRIKAYNLSVEKSAPLNAIARINLNALDQARLLDREFSQSGIRKPLFCVPVVLKDNIDSYDSISSSGSIALLGNQPIHDAVLTAKLRQAGAVILAKGTMDEFAAGMFGISGANGRTGNAYDTSKNSGGSSSGSAVAVSANFTLVAIGTDNSGSVRIPAAYNGIVGLRPSMGLVSQNGIFPRGNIDGVAGPMARTVEDLAKILDVIAKDHPKSYTEFLKEDGLRGKRIGIVQNLSGYDAFEGMPKNTKDIFQKAMQNFEKLGATIIPDIKLSQFDLSRKFNEAGEREDINEYLSSFPAARKNLLDICASNRTLAFGPVNDCKKFVKSLPARKSKKYQQVIDMIKKNKLYVESIMDKFNLDALVLPVTSNGKIIYSYKFARNETLASNANLPGLTINIGYTADNLPFGIDLVGRQFSEGNLISIAYAYQKHSPPRTLPKMPELNTYFKNFEISQYNNLLTQIGFDTNKNILMKCKAQDFSECLSADAFREIVLTYTKKAS